MSEVIRLQDRAIEAMLMPPHSERQVLVDGRAIPGLFARRGNGFVTFVLDGRFGCEVPDEFAIPVAYLVAQALAVGAGYPSSNAETRDKPFAPLVGDLSSEATP
jgi:hypothetical protein